MQLSGPVAAYIQEQEDITVAALYLSAGEFALVHWILLSFFLSFSFPNLNIVNLLRLFSCAPHGNGHASWGLGTTVGRHCGGAFRLNDSPYALIHRGLHLYSP
jgi:hypothetical protein